MSGLSSANNVGPYLLASVAIVCLTFIAKGDSLAFGSKGIGTKEVMQVVIDKGLITLSDRMDALFCRLESRIDSLEKKIDRIESTLAGVIIRRVGELGNQHDRVQRINYRNLAAVDLIVDKVSLDMEISEADTHMTKVSARQIQHQGFFFIA